MCIYYYTALTDKLHYHIMFWQVVQNPDPNHPALRNATLFAQLPNGPTVAVSLSSLMSGGGTGIQQQQVTSIYKPFAKMNTYVL